MTTDRKDKIPPFLYITLVPWRYYLFRFQTFQHNIYCYPNTTFSVSKPSLSIYVGVLLIEMSCSKRDSRINRHFTPVFIEGPVHHLFVILFWEGEERIATLKVQKPLQLYSTIHLIRDKNLPHNKGRKYSKPMKGVSRLLFNKIPDSFVFKV